MIVPFKDIFILINKKNRSDLNGFFNGHFYKLQSSPLQDSTIASLPRSSFVFKSPACSLLIRKSTLSISSSFSTDTSDFLYSLTPGNPWRYWTRCFRLSRIPFRPFASTRRRPCSCIIIRISERVGI